MKIKVSEASGPALNWMVATCEAVEVQCLAGFVYIQPAGWAGEYKPSEWWAQGGPIIERERITLVPMPNGTWQSAKDLRPHFQNPTPLIAAMRAFVFARLGDEVEVPDQLINKED